MKYNLGKYEVIHFGRKNKSGDYFPDWEKIQKSEVQRDLGNLVQIFLRGLEYKSRDVILRRYKALVSPHLEYCEQFWASYVRKDTLAL
eukprot:g14310.t1